MNKEIQTLIESGKDAISYQIKCCKESCVSKNFESIVTITLSFDHTKYFVKSQLYIFQKVVGELKKSFPEFEFSNEKENNGKISFVVKIKGKK